MCNRNETPSQNPSNDGTLKHTWLFEPETAHGGKAALTTDGLDYIAAHKYRPGHYTHLDNLMNPVWTKLTELLPTTVAPNMVTTIGALHCGLAYAVLWYFSPNFDINPPDWVVALSGYCTIAYYTFDCMDGKQARRTQTSSPLGQLFDHGFDCICNLFHCAGACGYLMIGGTRTFLLYQSTLQFCFFMAQWEEYYTHVLPHAMGDWFGVTEVNYGLGLFTIFNAFFVDRVKLWTRLMEDIVPVGVSDYLPECINKMELRYFGLSIWLFSLVTLVVGSLQRVFTHERVSHHNTFMSAVSKLITPLAICLATISLPAEVIKTETRYISLSAGLLFSFLTKKMICFSMAKQTFAAIQMDTIPFVLGCIWVNVDRNITPMGASLVFKILTVWNAYKMLLWSNWAIHQICERLNIYCFTIKTKSKDN